MLNMKYCRTENVIAALREWEDNPGTDEHLHQELYELCSRIAVDAGLAKTDRSEARRNKEV